MSLSLRAFGLTHVGCVRSNNEDNFGYDGRCGIYVVCDGMGGQAAGEIASKIAVDTVLDYFRRAAKTKCYPEAERTFEGVSARAGVLARAIELANQAICDSAAQNSGYKGMGSTIVAVRVEGSEYSIAHVGDSRIYLLRKQSIQQLTEDHSLVMQQVRRGLITEEQARHSDMQNIIIRALGSEDTVEPDLSDMAAEAGDTLLLTSDGLTRHLSNDGILDIVSRAASPKEACEGLIDAANRAGGHDNITCLLLRFMKASWIRKILGCSPGSPKWRNAGT